MLSPAERTIVWSGVGLLIVSTLPWFRTVPYASHNAWDNMLSAVAVLLGVAMAGQILVSRFSSARVPGPPVAWGRIHLVLGFAILALVLFQAILGDRATLAAFGVPGFEVQLDRKPGLFLGLLAAGGLAYGGFRRSQEPEGGVGGYLP